MKKIFVVMVLLQTILSVNSFAGGDNYAPSDKTYQIIYIDNSRSATQANLNLDMVDLIAKKVDSVKADPQSKMLFFLSNFENPDLAKDFKGATKLIERLTTSYSAVPDSRMDVKAIRAIVFNDDLSNIKKVVINVFVTETYMKNDLTGRNPGILLNFLPKELQALTGVSEENIYVNIYYPKTSTAIATDLLKTLSSATPDASFRARFVYTLKGI